MLKSPPKRMEPHSHTYYSNLRLLDSINDPKDLVNRAIDLGLSGIAITDHECLSAAPELNIYEKEVQKEHPEFKIALGDEIYLVEERKPKIDYYHFILIAKNAQGHRALRELSSKAWMQSYFDRDMERVPTLYSELEDIVKRFPNSLIATSACLGGCLSKNILGYLNGYKTNNEQEVYEHKTNIVNFLTYCLNLFGEDFYIECAPGCSKEQIAVNKELRTIAKAYNIKMVIGTDAHFLKKDDLFALDAYLNSQKGERETKLFYEYAYLQDDEDIRKHLQKSNFDDNFIDTMYDNSMEIYNKIETYSLLHHQSIPSVEVPETPKKENEFPNYPVLNEMNNSDDIVDRYWINSCSKALKDKGIYNDIYLSRLEEEAEVKKTISEKLNTNMFKYPITLQHYIDLFWECGSTVGAGRGSSCSGLNHYLLGITQLDPIKWNLPFYRYLNKERTELGSL